MCTYREAERDQRCATRARAATATAAKLSQARPCRALQELRCELVLPLGLAKEGEGVQTLMWRSYLRVW